ncbi:ATP-binding protein [Streptomyces sp. LS1784]|uniref:ATP-binding protein n=1 Tax=Streptomyces sp. LS1784 TaxID=2851533 RepID=UPI001CCA01E6|nr:ATP-binding protein [Streptomyces sp. LS1784]
MRVFAAAFSIAREPASVPFTRNKVAELLARWRVQLDSDSTTAVIVVTSELVTNAVCHTDGAELAVGVLVNPMRDRALIAVYDGSPVLPQTRESGHDAEDGRGMFLIQELATRYGTERTTRGKRVWAEVALPKQRLGRRRLIDPALPAPGGITPVSGAGDPVRAAPADRDRLGAFLTASWAALHVAILGMLGLLVHHTATRLEGAVPVSAPDRLIEDGHR